MAVTLARAHLHRTGIVDDPYAGMFLSRRPRAIAWLLGRPARQRLGRSQTITFLAARTRFFDAAVVDAIADGVTQVVVVGAGYDSRAWRLGRPGVRFFEVDHPATQEDKRRRAPAGSVTYVPVDLLTGRLEDGLRGHDLAVGERSLFVVEGLTMYLSEACTEATLATLARLGGPGSVLAVNFTARFRGAGPLSSRISAGLIRTRWRLAGEPIDDWGDERAALGVLRRAGWDPVEVLDGPALAARHLVGFDHRAVGLSPHACCVMAAKA